MRERERERERTTHIWKSTENSNRLSSIPEGSPTATTVPFLRQMSTAVLNALDDVAKQATA